MSPPRCIRPGQTWFLTRRTDKRECSLRPDSDGVLQNIYWYVTAVIAKERGVELHGVQMLSTHLHEMLTDTRAELPRFTQQRNRLFANAVKAHRKIKGSIFPRTGQSCVAVHGEDAIIRQMGYTLSNCIEAGLAPRPEDWSGVTTSIDDLGRLVVRATRPNVYFNPKNKRWPEEIEIRLTTPPAMVAHYGSEEAAATALRRGVKLIVDEAESKAWREQRKFWSKKAVCRVSPTARIESYEPIVARNPALAAGGDRDVLRRAIAQKRAFEFAHRSALERFRAGDVRVEFPFGTWKWCRELGLPMAAA